MKKRKKNMFLCLHTACEKSKYVWRIGDKEYKYCRHRVDRDTASQICDREGAYLFTSDSHDEDVFGENRFQ